MRLPLLAVAVVIAVPAYVACFGAALNAPGMIASVIPSAQAQPVRSLHDIPWYANHPAERNATIRLCRTDTAIARSPDCANAELGATRHRGSFAGVDQMLADPSYWAANRIARAGQLANCAAGRWNATPSSCAAARAGEAMDGNWVTKNGG